LENFLDGKKKLEILNFLKFRKVFKEKQHKIINNQKGYKKMAAKKKKAKKAAGKKKKKKY